MKGDEIRRIGEQTTIRIEFVIDFREGKVCRGGSGREGDVHDTSPMVKPKIGVMVGLKDLWSALGQVNGRYDDWAREIAESRFSPNHPLNGVAQSGSVILGRKKGAAGIPVFVLAMRLAQVDSKKFERRFPQRHPLFPRRTSKTQTKDDDSTDRCPGKQIET